MCNKFLTHVLQKESEPSKVDQDLETQDETTIAIQIAEENGPEPDNEDQDPEAQETAQSNSLKVFFDS